MRVWLTGCNGMLAQALCKQFRAARIDYSGTDMDVDLTSEAEVREYCKGSAFTHIVNAAAYTRVDDAEREYEKAVAVNGTAVRHLIEAADQLDATFVHFSTDYVFSGKASQPYVETEATAPASAYGKSKLEGENWASLALARAKPRVYVIRTSWLFGNGGNNFVRTILKAMIERDEVRVVDDQRGRPTYTEDLAEAAIALAGLNGNAPSSPGFYHFANSGTVSWYEFTVAVADAARSRNLTLKANRIAPVSSDEYKRPAPRPTYSVLDTHKIEHSLGRAPRDFRLALAEYLDVLMAQGKAVL